MADCPLEHPSVLHTRAFPIEPLEQCSNRRRLNPKLRRGWMMCRVTRDIVLFFLVVQVVLLSGTALADKVVVENGEHTNARPGRTVRTR